MRCRTGCLVLENTGAASGKILSRALRTSFKTPLTSIIGYADMLRSKQMAPEEMFLASNYIFTEGKRLEALSLKLLELMVLDRQEFEKRRVNPRVTYGRDRGPYASQSWKKQGLF